MHTRRSLAVIPSFIAKLIEGEGVATQIAIYKNSFANAAGVIMYLQRISDPFVETTGADSSGFGTTAGSDGGLRNKKEIDWGYPEHNFAICLKEEQCNKICTTLRHEKRLLTIPGIVCISIIRNRPVCSGGKEAATSH